MKRILLGATVLIASASPGVVFAEGDDQDLETLIEPAGVETASRRSQSLFETGPGVTVLSTADVQRLGLTNVAEILRYVPGASIQQLNANYFNIGLRGISEQWNNRVLVLLDGRTISDLSLGFPLFQNLPLHPDDIERIEVLRGPATTRFGANALSGVINIISKRPVDHRGLEGTVSGVTGYVPEEKHDETSGDIDNQPHVRTAGSGYLAYGWVNEAGTTGVRLSGGSARNPENTLSDASVPRSRHGPFSFFANAAFEHRPSENFDAFVNISTAQQESVFTPSFVASGTSSWSREHALTANLHWVPLEGLTLTLQGDGNVLDEQIPGLDVGVFVIPASSPKQRGIHAKAIADYVFWNGRNTFTFGIEGSTRKGFRLYGSDTGANYAGVVVEDELRLLSDRSLIVALGGRLERAATSTESDGGVLGNVYGNFNPRASVVYHPTRDHALRLSAATAYRTPTPFENYITLDARTFAAPTPPVTFFAGRAGLQAERARSVELGYRGIIGGRLLLDATVYAQQLRGIVSYGRQQSLPFFFLNVDGAVNNIGAELSFEYNVTKNLRAVLNYTYTHTSGETREGNVRLKGQETYVLGWPSHIFTAFGDLRFAAHWRFAGMAWGSIDAKSGLLEEQGYRGHQRNPEQVWLEAFLARSLFSGGGEAFVSCRNMLALGRNVGDLRAAPSRVYDPVGAQVVFGLRVAEVGL